MENNVTSELYAPLWVLATSVQVNQWQGQKRGTKFPILATIESFDAQGKCIKREWVKITAINGDVFTIERKFFSCLANDEANVQGRLSFDFVIGDRISMYIPKEIIERLNNAIDDLYDNGNERIKALPTGWLGIEVTAGNVRVGNQEFYFPWGQKVLNDNATNYVMLRGDSQIIIESERNQKYVKVATIATQNGAITDIKQRKIDAVGGELGGGWGFKKISDCVYRRGLLVQFLADWEQRNIEYHQKMIKKISSWEKIYIVNYKKDKLISVNEL